MGVLRIKIEHWRQVKIRVRWLPKNLDAYESSEPALAFRRWEEMCRQEDEEAMQQQQGSASTEGQSQAAQADGAKHGAQDVVQGTREETDVVSPAAAGEAEQHVAGDHSNPEDIPDATAEEAEQRATEEQNGYADDAPQATTETVEQVAHMERKDHVDDVSPATAAAAVHVAPAGATDQHALEEEQTLSEDKVPATLDEVEHVSPSDTQGSLEDGLEPKAEEALQHATSEVQSVADDKIQAKSEELERVSSREAQGFLEDGQHPTPEEALHQASLKQQSHVEKELQATSAETEPNAPGEQPGRQEDVPPATAEVAEEHAPDESKCLSENEQLAKGVEGELQLRDKQQSDLEDVLLVVNCEEEERALGGEEGPVEQAPQTAAKETEGRQPEEEQKDQEDAPQTVKDGAERYTSEEDQDTALKIVESLQGTAVNAEDHTTSAPDNNVHAAEVKTKMPDTKKEETPHANMEVDAQAQQSQEAGQEVVETDEARQGVETQTGLESEPDCDDSTRMLEGDTLEALVEVFRISEEEVAQRAKVDFVHDSMSTFSRSWLQLMTFYVWVFSKYESLNCGSSSMNLELIEKRTSEDPRFVAAFKASCVIKYNLRHCEVETLPVKLEYEFKIQKNTDLPDLEKLSEMSLEAELRFRDNFMLDSRFEPSLPPPHVTTLTEFLVRPISVSAENIESEDDVASRIAITITNHHKSRKLCICDVLFLLVYRDRQREKKSPLERAFAWYWVAREPTPYDIAPGQSWTIRVDIYSRREGYENKWFESPFEINFDWYDPDNAKHLDIYFSKHTIKWRAAATSIEEERKPIIDLDKATSNPYEGLIPLRPPSPPPPVQKPEFEVPPDRELFRIRRIFSGTKDPVTGARVFPPDDTESDDEQKDTSSCA